MLMVPKQVAKSKSPNGMAGNSPPPAPMKSEAAGFACTQAFVALEGGQASSYV